MKFCPTCGQEFPDSERFCRHDGTTLRPRDASADLIGTIIGERYHVLAKLGAGGMGEVYLAEHVRMKRKSAIKIMHPAMMADADAVSRFNREASNACQILHPNVAAIYDFGESAGGIVYLAMEYVEGDSLARLLAHGPLLPSRVSDLVRQIAAALDEAHRLGIVHRDLKPDNVLIGRRPDGGDLVKVVDFGISKIADDAQTVTRTGQVIGTPDYMSPEQLSGEPVDLRSDIYSLAIVAFAALSARLPFESDSVQTSMLRRFTERPRRLSEANASVTWPVELQDVLDRAMELDPAGRYPSASSFAAALASAVAIMPATTANEGMAAAGPRVVGPPMPTSASAASAASASSTSASSWSASDIAAIETRLAKAVGPIARVLVKRAAASATDRRGLIATLAAEIDDPKAREQFERG